MIVSGIVIFFEKTILFSILTVFFDTKGTKKMFLYFTELIIILNSINLKFYPNYVCNQFVQCLRKVSKY